MPKPEKIEDLLGLIKEKIDKGEFRDTFHSTLRKKQRSITRPEILYVLKNGRHENRKDKFDEYYNEWNYSIRGKTLDNKDLRVIISFDENNMIIITAIEIKSRG